MLSGGVYRPTTRDFITDDAFIFMWRAGGTISPPGQPPSSTSTLYLPTRNGGSYNFEVSWGDGKFDIVTAWDAPERVHTYAVDGDYRVEVRGLFTHLYQNPGWPEGEGQPRWLEVIQLGRCGWQNFDNGFFNLRYMTKFVSGSTDTSLVTSAIDMFADCITLSTPDLTGWETGNLVSVEQMFGRCVAMVTAPLMSDWIVPKLQDAKLMFTGCDAMINAPDISNWDTGNLTITRNMFGNCTAMTETPDVSRWDTSSLTNCVSMFLECSAMKDAPDVSRWNTTKLLESVSMFLRCSGLTSTPDVSNWYTPVLISADHMFEDCGSISGVKVSSWTIGKLEDADIFTSTPNAIDTAEYDKMLINWQAQDPPTQVTQFDLIVTAKYTAGGAAEAARTALMGASKPRWNITDGGPV